ncbi:hypothetical protein GCM10023238_27080 [Streptomyces heliomycini]
MPAGGGHGTPFPERRSPKTGHESWTATLRAGLAGARADRSYAGRLLVPAVGAVWGALDEYTPLLVRETGVADGTVPCLLLLIWAGATAGSCWPVRASGSARPGSRAAGRAGSPWPSARRRHPWGLGLFASPSALPGGDGAGRRPSPAAHRGHRPGTLTSVAGLGTELATVAVYGGYALIASGGAHGTAFAVFAVPYLATAAALLLAGAAGGTPVSEGSP